ncbi:MAG: hypothetical protein ACREC8_11665 [Limisphaerales bacterium]
MKRIGKIGICLVGGLALTASLSARETVSSNNPYEPIVARNVFDLNPPQPIDTTSHVEPPVKITPNGIMTIFGKRQVLFKVSVPAKPGIPAKEDDYILGEGQRQDDIEVTRIDEKSAVVTFNNHGVVQEIPLTVASATTTSLHAAVAENHLHPGVPHGNFDRRFGGVDRGRFGRNIAVGGGGNNNFNGANNAGNGNNFNNVNIGGNNFNGVNNSSSLQNVPAQQTAQQIDPDEQMIMIEAERQHYKSIGDPTAEILPPTPLTPPNATAPTP